MNNYLWGVGIVFQDIEIRVYWYKFSSFPQENRQPDFLFKTMSDVNSFNILDDPWLNKDTFIVMMKLMIFLLKLTHSRGGHFLIISFRDIGHRIVLIELKFSAIVVLDVDWGDRG